MYDILELALLLSGLALFGAGVFLSVMAFLSFIQF